MSDNTLDDKLAYSIPNFAKAVDISETTVREAIKKGNLIPSYPAKAKPIIPTKEALRWLDALPVERPE